VHESLTERAELLGTAPHLLTPVKFLLPIFAWQKRSSWFVHAGELPYAIEVEDTCPRRISCSAARSCIPCSTKMAVNAVRDWFTAKA
jgi:glycerol-3-phosphate dehydrogenase